MSRNCTYLCRASATQPLYNRFLLNSVGALDDMKFWMLMSQRMWTVGKDLLQMSTCIYIKKLITTVKSMSSPQQPPKEFVPDSSREARRKTKSKSNFKTETACLWVVVWTQSHACGIGYFYCTLYCKVGHSLFCIKRKGHGMPICCSIKIPT